jgi:hypothetical protein
MADQDFLSYSSVYSTFSKGPKSIYYGIGDEMLPGFILNVPQSDDDDEWGRTDRIADERTADYIARIYKTLFDPYNAISTISLVPGEAGSELNVAKNMIRLIGRAGIDDGVFDLSVPSLTLGDIILDGDANTITIGTAGFEISETAINIPATNGPFNVYTLASEGILEIGTVSMVLFDDTVTRTTDITVNGSKYSFLENAATFDGQTLRVDNSNNYPLILTTDPAVEPLIIPDTEAVIKFKDAKIILYDDGVSPSFGFDSGTSHYLLGSSEMDILTPEVYIGAGGLYLGISAQSTTNEGTIYYGTDVGSSRVKVTLYEDGSSCYISFTVNGQPYLFGDTEMIVPPGVALSLGALTTGGDVTLTENTGKVIIGCYGAMLTKDTLTLISATDNESFVLTAESPFDPGAEGVLTFGKANLFIHDVNPGNILAYCSVGFSINGTSYEFNKDGIDFAQATMITAQGITATDITLSGDITAVRGIFSDRVTSDYFQGSKFGLITDSVVICGHPTIKLSAHDGTDVTSITIGDYVWKPGGNNNTSLGSSSYGFTDIWLYDGYTSSSKRVRVCNNSIYID